MRSNALGVLKFEKLKGVKKTDETRTRRIWSIKFYRSMVPGGWLVFCRGSSEGGMTFIPDPNHQWDGNSLP